jgi:hypothetical protein
VAGTRTNRRIAVLVLAILLAGCTSAPASTPGATRPETTPPPSSAGPSPYEPTLPSTSPSIAARGWSADSAAALDELMIAIGNPDTGSKSDAWIAFEAALTSRVGAAIVSSADVVLGHLDRARALLAPYLQSAQSGIGAREWDALMVGIADGVARMRDGGVAGSTADVEAGRTRMSDALRDHFYQAVYGPSSDRWQIRWPWPDSRIVTPSRSRLANEAGQAFDGQPGSFWVAGDVPAPQWIEIDLGRVVTITGVRLLTVQSTAGPTDHRVTISGPNLPSSELVAFTGTTADSQWLESSAPRPIAGVQVVRVTTLASPSMVGWREIEVVLAPESRLEACANGTTNLALRRPATASASASGSTPALAVDGDRATRWDAGAAAPQSIELDLGRAVSIGSVRLLPGGPADAAIAAVVRGRDEAGHTMVLGAINQATTGIDWLTVAGPTPCVGLRWIGVESGWSLGPVSWREIQVLGPKSG